MSRKIIPIASVLIISGLAIIFLIGSNDVERDVLSQTFFIDAFYNESEGYVEISFEDKSKKTNSIVLEILGMEESFQKNYDSYSFVERIPFDNTPKYGWEIHPVTLVLEHPEFGKIGIKTEIHSVLEPAPPVIYSRL